MIIKKNLYKPIVLLFGIFVFSFFIPGFILGVGENIYCAERTISEAWCQNVALEEVDQTYRNAPASCEATSYCKLGTCVNSQEGTCLENTPQKVCEEPDTGISGGIWFDKASDEIPQCSLGCCILGDQAAFVTQTRCKQLSSTYGLKTNYRTDIQSEVACISTTISESKGACVFEKDFERTCKFTTRNGCEEIEKSSGSSNIEFHESFLCSAEELATNCGPSEKTTLVEGKDEIYFIDTCGNLANIYDGLKINDKNYWRDIFDKSESCGFGDINTNGNAGSETCGNCDYFLGSTGKNYDRSIDPVSPRFGDYICRDLGCTYQEEDYNHGETWCSSSSENNDNLPGERYFRLVCYNGDVTVEPCSDFRQEICIGGEVNGFSTAACRVNKWQDCTSQEIKKDCENTERRDCNWIQGSCVPKYSPGFDFWEAGTDAEPLCALANNGCVVEYEKGLLDGDWECKKNCECLTDEWAGKQNNICLALGDCGVMTNFIGKEGFHELSDLITKSERAEEK